MDYPKPIASADDLPKAYEGLARERFWQEYWDAAGVYKFEPYVDVSGTDAPVREESEASNPTGDGARATKRLRTREEIFSVDTPPPTVSGALHIGHVYSYTQTDMNVRYRRMTGKHIFYPFGFDDNGLPTERLVEKERGIRAHEVSREEFIAMCQEVSAKYEAEFIALWKSLAISCDWEQFYTTIDERSRAISQASFIDLYNKGYVYRKVAPTQWDWVNQTAIAQAEIEDREVPGVFHYIKFAWADGPGAPVRGELVIGTTRPELIPACVAVMVNPESEDFVHDHEGQPLLDNDGNKVRHTDLIGKIAITPLFEVEVPILPSEKADPEKGTGILMCCTFGDQEDVEHWEREWPEELVPEGQLEHRVIFNKKGRVETFTHMLAQLGSVVVDLGLSYMVGDPADPVPWQPPPYRWSNVAHTRNLSGAQALAGDLTGEGIIKAQGKLVVALAEAGLLVHSQQLIHTVRFSERGDRPVELLITYQWYVNLLEHKSELIEQGRQVCWHPHHMRKRYEQWVDGLNSDWCISRQRYNGVPFPVWYVVKDETFLTLGAHISNLPVNPLQRKPTDQEFSTVGISDGDKEYAFADPDVMDTWATSSVTPLLNTHLMPTTNPVAAAARRRDGDVEDGGEPPPPQINSDEVLQRHAQLFPFDMRPQAHDIIRTWAFYTIAKAYFHFGTIPWKDIVISGHAQDASRAKMSKSKGNVVTPAEMVGKYSADGLRYWSGSVKLGADTVYDETKLGEGRKLINKLFNATKFALRHLVDYDPRVGAKHASPAAQPQAGQNSANQPGEARLVGEACFAPTAFTEFITYPTDRWLIAKLNAAIERATAAHEAFEFGDAKQAVEDFFWADFCDNYLEFSKGRLYGEPLAVEAHTERASSDPHGGPGGPPHYSPEQLKLSAQATLYIALSAILRMFAPILPHITEECWSWYFAQFSNRRSIHEEHWPTAIAVGTAGLQTGSSASGSQEAGLKTGGPVSPTDLLISTVAAVRKWKSERSASVKKPLARVDIYLAGDKPETASASAPAVFTDADLAAVLGDLLSTCNAQRAVLHTAEPAPQDAVTVERSPIAVTCELAADEA